jgi:hypothetical protein
MWKTSSTVVRAGGVVSCSIPYLSIVLHSRASADVSADNGAGCCLTVGFRATFVGRAGGGKGFLVGGFGGSFFDFGAGFFAAIFFGAFAGFVAFFGAAFFADRAAALGFFDGSGRPATFLDVFVLVFFAAMLVTSDRAAVHETSGHATPLGTVEAPAAS